MPNSKRNLIKSLASIFGKKMQTLEDLQNAIRAANVLIGKNSSVDTSSLVVVFPPDLWWKIAGHNALDVTFSEGEGKLCLRNGLVGNLAKESLKNSTKKREKLSDTFPTKKNSPTTKSS